MNSFRHLAITLDPLHVGAGGYRLGRVDNTIVRDAGSGLPKIPGSSLAGAVRCYAEWFMQDNGLEEQEKRSAVETLFGYASDNKRKDSRIGLLRFYDGHILAFPVKSMAGPVWVTCPSVLAQADILLTEKIGEEEVLITFNHSSSKLNLGWLYLPAKKSVLLSSASTIRQKNSSPELPSLPTGCSRKSSTATSKSALLCP